MASEGVLVCGGWEKGAALAPVGDGTHVFSLMSAAGTTVAQLQLPGPPLGLLYQTPYVLFQGDGQFWVYRESGNELEQVAGPVSGVATAIKPHNEELYYTTKDGLYRLDGGRPTQITAFKSRSQLFCDDSALLVGKDTMRVRLDDGQKECIHVAAVHASGQSIIFERNKRQYVYDLDEGAPRVNSIPADPTCWDGPVAFFVEQRDEDTARISWKGLDGREGEVDVLLARGTKIIRPYVAGGLLLCMVATPRGTAVAILNKAPGLFQ